MDCIRRRRFLLTAIVLICGLVAIRNAAAGPFSNLVVFGDSLSDVGNIAQAPFINEPGPYYWNGRFSNGPVYAETLATGLGLPALTRSTASGNDFAYGGAQTTGTGFPDNLFVQDIDDQVSKYLGSRTANATTLYALFAGANDLLGGQTNMSVPVNSLQSSMNRLITAGARNFVVFNLPPLGNTPRYNTNPSTLSLYNSRSQQFNSALSTMLDGVQSNNPAVTIKRFDTTALFNEALANPQLLNLTNVTSSAAPGLSPGDTTYDTSRIVPNPNQYLFWDDLHPTAAVHLILAHQALDLFLTPGDFNRNVVNESSDYVTWRKGLGTTYVPIDYDIWREHYGQASADAEVLSSAAGNVPEPCGWALVVTLFFGVCGSRPCFRPRISQTWRSSRPPVCH